VKEEMSEEERKKVDAKEIDTRAKIEYIRYK
jgi:hypothetical protein